MGVVRDFIEFAVRRTGKSSGEVLDALRTVLPKGAPTPAAVKSAAPPAPVLPAPRPAPRVTEEATQLRLPLESREGGRLVSPYGRGKTDPAVVRQSLQPRLDEAPAPVRVPDPWRDQYGQQLELPVSPFGRPTVRAADVTETFIPRGQTSDISVMSSPLRGVGELDPGTLRSLQDLSQRASRQYGIPADEIFGRITAPGGTDYLNELAGRNVLQNIVGRISGRTGLAPETINKIFAGAGTGLGVGLAGALGYQLNRPAQPDQALQLTNEQLYPEAPSLPAPEPESGVDTGRALGADTSEAPVVIPPTALRPLGSTPGTPAVAPAPVAQKPLGVPTLETDGDLAAYYTARSAYANQPAIRAELMEFAARGLTGERAAAMKAWAKQNPALAYELQRRQMADPGQSLQSGQNVQSKALGTQLGTDNVNNAQGSADSVSQSVMNPSAGSYDMMNALEPLEKPVLLSQQQARDYAEGSVGAGETFTDKLLRMAARRNQFA